MRLIRKRELIYLISYKLVEHRQLMDTVMNNYLMISASQSKKDTTILNSLYKTKLKTI